jgi:hypothetical protein
MKVNVRVSLEPPVILGLVGIEIIEHELVTLLR